ncbi:MAG: hypothetical protein NVSMB51_10200 [Solirubrobacteraceae bacterium]
MLAIVLFVGVLAVVTIGTLGAKKHMVHAIFQNASQLVKGNRVQVGGVSIGTVKTLSLTPDGRADAALQIDPGNYWPLRQGTIATVRQASLSGVANRYVDIQLAPAGAPKIADDGRIEEASTNSAVDLDQLFNTLDSPTRQSLQGVVRGLANLTVGQATGLQQGYMYLNPALASSSALFGEINYDTPMLTRFIVASSKLVTDIAAKRDDLSGLIDHLATTTQAIGAKRTQLAASIRQLPPFFTQANTTFANLRPTLDRLTVLVNDSKPVAVKLRPFFAQLRGVSHDARPTLRALQQLIQNPATPNSDLLSLTNSTPPVDRIANGPVQVDGANRPGAFPASAQALATATPELGFARPYSPDLTSWFNSFSHSGVVDAYGGASRVAPIANAFSLISGVLTVVPPNLRQSALASVLTTRQLNRCPGTGEHSNVDGSNPWVYPGNTCDPTQIPPGK